MAFTVPDSSPPSTPDFKSQSLASNPSTTPAGPPPSSTASFTPQGQPPASSTFGSSRAAPRSKLSFSQSAFDQSGNFDGSESLFSSLSSSKLPPLPGQKSGNFRSSFESRSGFGVTNGSQFNGFGSRAPNLSRMSEQPEEDEEGEDDEEEYEDEDEDDDGDYEDEEEGDEESDEEEEFEGDEEEEDDDDMEVEPTNNTSGSSFGFSDVKFSPGPDHSTEPSKQKMIYSKPEDAKRAKLDEQWATSSPAAPNPRRGPTKPSQIPNILQNLVSNSDMTQVDEPGYVIIATEEYIGDMLDKAHAADSTEAAVATTLSETTSALIKLWNTAASEVNTYRPAGAIGPANNAKGYEKATFLTSLLLPLHHPPLTSVSGGNVRASAVRAASRSLVLSGSNARAYVPVPRVLIDWLNNNHSTLAEEVEHLITVHPNPTASADFWDVVQAGVLHGAFADMAALLRNADFNYARSALQDGLAQPGYRGAQLQNIQKVVNKAIQLLEASPLVQDDNWDVRDMEWSAYRKRIHSALLELEEFAEGQDPAALQPPSSGPRFQASNFGMAQGPSAAQSGFSFSQSMRMAESRIPWSIYQSLKGIYGIILGEAETIMTASQDWVEATIGLTAWWDGVDDSDSFGQSVNGFGANALGNKGTKSQAQRSFNRNPQEAYVRRLDYNFALVTDDTWGDAAFRPNTVNAMEVALAAVFEGNVVGLLHLFETWSLCLTSAVVEVANVGGWLDTSAGRKPLPGFLNENDLMVLSYGQNNNPTLEPLSKDDILLAYAEALFSKGPFEYQGSLTEGWELALQVLSRMEDIVAVKKKVAELLEKLPVETIEQVDKVVLLCTDLGFEVEGRQTSETHGDRILSSSTKGDCDYGLAMICYARARATRKVKDVANMLIANSLAQSRAYPPDEQLGGQLRSLIKDPKSCLSAVAAADREAARILQYYASGYATLRRFYDLRDQAVLAGQEGHNPQRLRPLARKRAAADTLVAVIRSSADSIYGGLYDGERDSAVLVDGLLVLLGEALIFVNESSSSSSSLSPLPILSKAQQSAILAAVEDLESVTPRVRAACEDFFRKTLDEYRREQRSSGSSPSSFAPPPSFNYNNRNKRQPPSLSLSASTGSFSLIGSDLLGSAGGESGSGSSGVLIARPSVNEYSAPIQRGWDWRAGLLVSSGEGEDQVRASDVLRMLRMRLAKTMVWR